MSSTQNLAPHLSAYRVERAIAHLHRLYCVPGSKDVREWTPGHWGADRIKAVALLDGFASDGLHLCEQDFVAGAL